MASVWRKRRSLVRKMRLRPLPSYTKSVHEDVCSPILPEELVLPYGCPPIHIGCGHKSTYCDGTNVRPHTEQNSTGRQDEDIFEDRPFQEHLHERQNCFVVGGRDIRYGSKSAYCDGTNYHPHIEQHATGRQAEDQLEDCSFHEHPHEIQNGFVRVTGWRPFQVWIQEQKLAKSRTEPLNKRVCFCHARSHQEGRGTKPPTVPEYEIEPEPTEDIHTLSKSDESTRANRASDSCTTTTEQSTTKNTSVSNHPSPKPTIHRQFTPYKSAFFDTENGSESYSNDEEDVEPCENNLYDQYNSKGIYENKIQEEIHETWGHNKTEMDELHTESSEKDELIRVDTDVTRSNDEPYEMHERDDIKCSESLDNNESEQSLDDLNTEELSVVLRNSHDAEVVYTEHNESDVSPIGQHDDLEICDVQSHSVDKYWSMIEGKEMETKECTETESMTGEDDVVDTDTVIDTDMENILKENHKEGSSKYQKSMQINYRYDITNKMMLNEKLESDESKRYPAGISEGNVIDCHRSLNMQSCRLETAENTKEHSDCHEQQSNQYGAIKSGTMGKMNSEPPSTIFTDRETSAIQLDNGVADEMQFNNEGDEDSDIIHLDSDLEKRQQEGTIYIDGSVDEHNLEQKETQMFCISLYDVANRIKHPETDIPPSYCEEQPAHKKSGARITGGNENSCLNTYKGGTLLCDGEAEITEDRNKVSEQTQEGLASILGVIRIGKMGNSTMRLEGYILLNYGRTARQRFRLDVDMSANQKYFTTCLNTSKPSGEIYNRSVAENNSVVSSTTKMTDITDSTNLLEEQKKRLIFVIAANSNILRKLYSTIFGFREQNTDFYFKCLLIIRLEEMYYLKKQTVAQAEISEYLVASFSAELQSKLENAEISEFQIHENLHYPPKYTNMKDEKWFDEFSKQAVVQDTLEEAERRKLVTQNCENAGSPILEKKQLDLKRESGKDITSGKKQLLMQKMIACDNNSQWKDASEIQVQDCFQTSFEHSEVKLCEPRNVRRLFPPPRRERSHQIASDDTSRGENGVPMPLATNQVPGVKETADAVVMSVNKENVTSTKYMHTTVNSMSNADIDGADTDGLNMSPGRSVTEIRETLLTNCVLTEQKMEQSGISDCDGQPTNPTKSAEFNYLFSPSAQNTPGIKLCDETNMSPSKPTGVLNCFQENSESGCQTSQIEISLEDGNYQKSILLTTNSAEHYIQVGDGNRVLVKNGRRCRSDNLTDQVDFVSGTPMDSTGVQNTNQRGSENRSFDTNNRGMVTGYFYHKSLQDTETRSEPKCTGEYLGVINATPTEFVNHIETNSSEMPMKPSRRVPIVESETAEIEPQYIVDKRGDNRQPPDRMKELVSNTENDVAAIDRSDDTGGKRHLPHISSSQLDKCVKAGPPVTDDGNSVSRISTTKLYRKNTHSRSSNNGENFQANGSQCYGLENDNNDVLVCRGGTLTRRSQFEDDFVSMAGGGDSQKAMEELSVTLLLMLRDTRTLAIRRLVLVFLNKTGVLIKDSTDKSTFDHREQPLIGLDCADGKVLVNFKKDKCRFTTSSVAVQSGINCGYGIPQSEIKHLTERQWFVPWKTEEPTPLPDITRFCQSRPSHSFTTWTSLIPRGTKRCNYYLRFRVNLNISLINALFEAAKMKSIQILGTHDLSTKFSDALSDVVIDYIADGRIADQASESCSHTLNQNNLQSANDFQIRIKTENISQNNENGYTSDTGDADAISGIQCTNFEGCSPSYVVHRTNCLNNCSKINELTSAIYLETLDSAQKLITQRLNSSDSFADFLDFLEVHVSNINESGWYSLRSDNLIEVIDKLCSIKQYVQELLFVILNGLHLGAGVNINEMTEVCPLFELCENY